MFSAGPNPPPQSTAQPSASSFESASRFGFHASQLLTAAWWLNLVALIALVAWLSFDGYLSRFSFELLPMLKKGLTIDGNFVVNEGLTYSRSLPRQLFGSSLILLGAVTMVILGWGLFLGPPRFRTTRGFLATVILATLWILVLSSWTKIVETGKDLRVAQEVEPLEHFARSTLEQWETLTDEKTSPDYSQWTAFNAYPVNKPRMLFFLGEQEIPKTDVKVRSIEYTPGEAIRFELASEQVGNWLELRLNEQPPQDFVGGLEAPFEAVQWKRLRNQLYIVRYR